MEVKQRNFKTMFYKDKKVVVTGGSGFVGTNFILELLERGADVTTHTHIRPMEIQDERIRLVKDIDLFKLDDCIKLLYGADYVIHCGGYITNPAQVRTNVQVLLHNINSTANAASSVVKETFSGANSLLTTWIQAYNPDYLGSKRHAHIHFF